jgi:hypothetical protein
MDLDDLRNCAEVDATLKDSASFLCRLEYEVQAKAKELGYGLRIVKKKLKKRSKTKP